MGQARDPTISTQGSTDEVRLHLWRDLPGRGQRRRPDTATLQYRGDDAPLAEISATGAPGAHAALLLDQAGWHGSRSLVVPATSRIVCTPAGVSKRTSYGLGPFSGRIAAR